jgi:hypothetical protein
VGRGADYTNSAAAHKQSRRARFDSALLYFVNLLNICRCCRQRGAHQHQQNQSGFRKPKSGASRMFSNLLIPSPAVFVAGGSALDDNNKRAAHQQI